MNKGDTVYVDFVDVPDEGIILGEPKEAIHYDRWIIKYKDGKEGSPVKSICYASRVEIYEKRIKVYQRKIDVEKKRLKALNTQDTEKVEE